ncbi:MAG: MBL fold metallo-hydrolase, partial [Opitutaceae bacterium]
MRRAVFLLLACGTALTFETALPATAADGGPPVRELKITVLSTMLAGDPLFKGIGEWGFAALVEVDGRRMLFDTGLRPNTVLHNARELGIDLGAIQEVVLSHNHPDHVGGLLTLRRALSRKNPEAMSRVHVARGIFWNRGTDESGRAENAAAALKPDFEAAGGSFIEHAGPAEIAPGVWLTGPVPRVYPEKNFGGTGRVESPAG